MDFISRVSFSRGQIVQLALHALVFSMETRLGKFFLSAAESSDFILVDVNVSLREWYFDILFGKSFVYLGVDFIGHGELIPIILDPENEKKIKGYMRALGDPVE